jgi:hypothetical protein
MKNFSFNGWVGSENKFSVTLWFKLLEVLEALNLVHMGDGIFVQL